MRLSVIFKSVKIMFMQNKEKEHTLKPEELFNILDKAEKPKNLSVEKERDLGYLYNLHSASTNLKEIITYYDIVKLEDIEKKATNPR